MSKNNKNWKPEYDAEARAHSATKTRIRDLEERLARAEGEAKVLAGANTIREIRALSRDLVEKVQEAVAYVPAVDDCVSALEKAKASQSAAWKAHQTRVMERDEARSALVPVTAERDALASKVTRYERTGVLGTANARRILALLPKGWETRASGDLFAHMSKFTPDTFRALVDAMWKFHRDELLSRGYTPGDLPAEKVEMTPKDEPQGTCSTCIHFNPGDERTGSCLLDGVNEEPVRHDERCASYTANRATDAKGGAL